MITRAEARRLIRDAGLRATRGRVEMLVYLASRPAPVTHNDTIAAFEGADRVSLWRNLNDLAEEGLIVRADLGDHLWRFWYGSADRFDLLSGLRNVQIAC